MKLFNVYRRGLLVGSTLLAAPAASCSLDQAMLDSIVAAVSGFEGNIDIHVNGVNNGNHEGEDDDDSDAEDHGGGKHDDD